MSPGLWDRISDEESLCEEPGKATTEGDSPVIQGLQIRRYPE